jgi:phthalate 4,5-cis-dihydrodiol dehydrogenase
MAASNDRFDAVTGALRGDEGTADRPAAPAADQRFRIGIAGYDLWPHAMSFCRALGGADFCRISAVWDDEPRHLERLVEVTGATGYADLAAFCRSDVQGVIITARTNLRCSIAEALAGAGKHVLSDKPMAMTPGECRAIIRACREGGVLLMGGYNFRFWKTWQLMRRIVETGELGDLQHLYCAYNTGMIQRSEWEETYDSDWTNPAATPGGGWFTHGDHPIDLTRWVFGVEFIEVVADMRRLRYPQYAVEDYGVAHFLLSNGGTAVIHSDAISPRIRLEVVAICRHGGIAYTMVPEPRLKVWGVPSLGAGTVEYAVPENWVDALREMTRAFVRAVEAGSAPPITGLDNMRVMEVAEATYRSAREGKSVAILQTPAE